MAGSGGGDGAAAHTSVDPGSGTAPRRPALSPSRASDFKRCPLLYRFRAVDRLPETPTRAQVRGTLVHAVLEALFALPAAERTPAAAHALLGPAWDGLLDEAPELEATLFPVAAGPAAERSEGHPRAPRAPIDTAAERSEGHPSGARAAIDTAQLAVWLDSASALLDTYFTLEDPRTVVPAAVEERVEVELSSGVPLRGVVDRLDVVDGGRVRVVDYKTGSSPGAWAELGALFQLKFYALAVLTVRGEVPAELRLLYLADGQVLAYTPDADELVRFGRLLEALWAAVLEAGRSGDFRPNPGPACRGCDFTAVCPAWDGTPPPYPGWPDGMIGP